MKLSEDEQSLFDTMSPLDKLKFEFSYLRERVPDNRYTAKQMKELEAILDKIAKYDEKVARWLSEGLDSSTIAIGKK